MNPTRCRAIVTICQSEVLFFMNFILPPIFFWAALALPASAQTVISPGETGTLVMPVVLDPDIPAAT